MVRFKSNTLLIQSEIVVHKLEHNVEAYMLEIKVFIWSADVFFLAKNFLDKIFGNCPS